jgi:hypothetical protein
LNIEKSRSKTGKHLTIDHKKSISHGLTKFNIPNESVLKRKYNLTLEEWVKFKNDQNNKCPICLTDFNSTPCVDHDHKSGRNRGLLCQKCNRILGQFKDDVNALSRAFNYLSKFQKLNC